MIFAFEKLNSFSVWSLLEQNFNTLLNPKPSLQKTALILENLVECNQQHISQSQKELTSLSYILQLYYKLFP